MERKTSIANETKPVEAEAKAVITPEMLMGYLDTSPLDGDPDVESTLAEITALADDMNHRNLEPKDLLNMTRADFSFWETTLKLKEVLKDDEGEAVIGANGKEVVVQTMHTVPNRARKYQLRPHADVMDISPLIATPPPIKMYTTKTTARKVRQEKIAVDLPDIQFSFREHRDGSFTPVHDTRAIDVALQITRDIQPDLIISGGDELDLPEVSRFKADSTHFMSPHSLARAVRGLGALLGQIRVDNQDADIKMVSSNHAERWINYMMANAPQFVEVRPTDDPEGLPLLSLERALGLKALDIDYISGYSAAKYQINDRLITFHGDKSKNNGSTAQEYLKENHDQSVMFHHTHRMENEMKTLGGRVIRAFSNGCLASTQGAVPSFHNAVTTDGEIVPYQENWQNGIGIIHYNEGNSPFQVEQVLIDHNDGYRAFYNGKWYEPRPQAQRTWEQFEEGLRIREFPATV